MTSTDGPGLTDWDFAAATAIKLAKPGPRVKAVEATKAVAQLRGFAHESEGHVREFTHLTASSGTAPVLVVDRPGWIRGNAASFADLSRPLADKVAERAADKGPSPRALAASAKATGLEVGVLLSYMSSRVLGQFDPFFNPGPGSGDQPDAASGAGTGADERPVSGRLMLVAPNVVEIEQELGVDPRDFRFWVCLHEETHRVQFTAVDWLSGYVRGLIDDFFATTDLDGSALAARLRSAVAQMARTVRSGEQVNVQTLLMSPEQRAVMDKVTAVMSLLEGHADVVMDGVGPSVIPSVATIRDRFEHRRKGANPLDALIRKLMGLEMKLRQYRDGAVFVRGAVDKVGMDGFNAVWAGPEYLPRTSELTDPDAWVARVHG